MSDSSFTFGTFLARLLAARKMTQRAFAEAVKYDQPSIAAVISGRRKPPLKRLERWADVLGLKGAERERFLLLGALERSPPIVQSFVRRHL